MKKILNIILVFIGLAGLSSCEEFLDRSPISDLDPQNFFRSESEIRSATLNIYTYMDDLRMLRLEQYSDNCFGRKNKNAIAYTYGTHTPSLGIFEETWSENYQGIAQANLVINAEIGEDVSDDLFNSYVGDAYFMRAWYYSDLLFLFGEVPIVTDAPSVTGDIFPAKSSIDDVKQQIINDLDEALKYLPVDPEKGRASIGAAQMLKAKTHIFMSEFEDAKDAAKAVIDLQKYELFDDFRELFYEESENTNKEVIFAIQFVASLRPSSFYQKIVNSSRFAICLELANLYEMEDGTAIDDPNSGYDPQKPYLNRDPRYRVTILTPGDSRTIDGVETPLIGRTTASITAMIGDKYKNWDKDYSVYNGSDYILMRYADALLLYAEALNEVSSSPGTEVYDAVDQVRARVGLPGLPAGLSKDVMRTRIRNERRKELAMESQRLFDIFRWDIGDEAYNGTFDGYNQSKLDDLNNLVFEIATDLDPNRNYDPERGYFWPIPQTEIDVNENLVQNPGYN
ncbi:RagB/SusD family nutrient uptake outer membrane protein [Maribellus comscasis]|uniref:RagB/SusD family nutrient uptake outer membrane protein n=1 Tax=Maribellus comscasis TaxID=2681766 RepID=A0A6I6K0I1_9BACT|nr:RagB/SusD family nutrient uptake outer membrane protein [Maribellus comscasis]QGY46950.1 RagB/SusD family nutrient uptake outer membrane protein [Maribellus comscasis]